MSLRKRLVLLLAVFGMYGVVATALSLYGKERAVERAVLRYGQADARAARLARLGVLLSEHGTRLRAAPQGPPSAVRRVKETQEAFVRALREVDDAAGATAGSAWLHIIALSEALHQRTTKYVGLVEAGRYDAARSLLASSIEAELIPSLRTELNSARSASEAHRARAARELASTSSRIVTLSVLVALFALGLILLGAILIRRWVFEPLAELREVTRRYEAGDLAARVCTAADDELGELGNALNAMARSVAASERKYRSLFANLRDAVVICRADGSIVEYHDGETGLLRVDEGTQTGRKVLEVWPEWTSAMKDWPAVIRAATQGRRFHAVNVPVQSSGADTVGPFADFLVYHVEYGEEDCAAIVLRDVSERQHLQARLRQAATLEAVGTMAGGLAHDVNNLLAGIAGTLGALSEELTDEQSAERARTALGACRRAAGLSKRLLNFASGAHGTPQAFAPATIIDTIVASVDDSFRQGVTIQTDIDPNVQVHMDQDQFAQIVLNLLKNARDATPPGGSLSVSLRTETARLPNESHAERAYALLVVKDTGQGMSPEVERRVFEPFFTTKSRAPGRGRGLGLTIVHTAVQSAGGFVRVRSESGVGTTFSVYLPLRELSEPAPVEAAGAE